MKNEKIKLIAALLSSLLWCAAANAQNATPEMEPDPEAPEGAPEVEEINIAMTRDSLPGSSDQWTKLIISFESVPRWNDGVYVAAEVLMKSGNRMRIIKNDTRLLNVKKGVVNVPFYISPLSAERFGQPLAVYAMVVTGEGEGDVLQTTWESPAAEDLIETWRTDYVVLPGLLLNMLQTPWLVYDYGKTPDFAQ